jgi:hypothetical protein
VDSYYALIVCLVLFDFTNWISYTIFYRSLISPTKEPPEMQWKNAEGMKKLLTAVGAATDRCGLLKAESIGGHPSTHAVWMPTTKVLGELTTKAEAHQAANTHEKRDPAVWPNIMGRLKSRTSFSFWTTRSVISRQRLDSCEKLKRQRLVYCKPANRVLCFCCKIFRFGVTTSIVSSETSHWKH